MKKVLFLSLAALIGSFSSCTNDDFEGVNRVTESISAIIVDGESRTVLDGLQVKWSESEAISVFYTSDDYQNPQNLECTMTSGAGTTSAEFNIVLEGANPQKLAALYPYSNASSFSGGVITLTMPETHQYVENGISGAPMAALISNNSSLISFKNAGALLGVTVNNIPAGYDRATLVSSTEAIAGECQITFDASGNPTLITTNATEKQIDIEFEASNTLSNKTFYFPIPVDEYTSLEMSISKSTDSESKIVLKTKGLDAERSNRYKSTLTLDAVTGAIPEETTIEDASEALKTNTNITVDEVASTDQNPTIILPEETENKEVNIVFESITSSTVINIDAANDSKVASTVNITVPTEGDQAKLNIDLPNTTVKITVAGTSGTIAELTATTAEETLIIGKGVSVGSLTVNAGNVRIEGGKITTSITNNQNKRIIYVIADDEDLGTYQALNQTIKDAITEIVCTLDEYVVVKSAAELYAASKGAKNIKIGTQITIEADKPVNPINGQTYDLNEKTVGVATSGSKDVFRIEQENAVVTIKNGTINNQNGSNYALSIRADNVTLNMEDVTIPANNYGGSLYKSGNYEGCTVKLTNCTFNGVVYLSNTDDKAANTLTVRGGTFTSTTQNCFELLNTDLTMSGATLNNNVTEQSYQVNGNEGNNFSKPLGYCIAFTNTDGVAAQGSATLSNNTYNIADADGDYIFNQMGGATLNMEVSRFNEFKTVAAAGGEIKLLNDIMDAVGLSINKGLIVDFNSKTYTMDKPGTGSAGTQTLGLQLLQGNDITFKNGTIKCSDSNKDLTWVSSSTEKGIAMMIQNYANLTLENMTINGTNIAHNGNNMRYIVSNNSGQVNLTGSTSITAPANDVAFDVCKYDSYAAPEVTVNTTGTITGLVEVSGGTLNVTKGTFNNEKGHCVKVVNGHANFNGGTFTAQEVAVFNLAGSVNIENGTFTSNDNAVISGNGTDDDKYKGGTIEISGGTFNANIHTEGYVACGIYHPQQGTLKVTGGTFNIENGCGILMRGGTLDITISNASFTFTGDVVEGTTGKVGDSRVVVPCGKKIVKDVYSDYYDANNITITGAGEDDIYTVENQN